MTNPTQALPAPELSAKANRPPLGELLTRLGPVIGLVFVFVIFAFMNPKDFLTLDNFTTILYLTTVVATAALGMTLIIIAGGIDLSVGSSIALVTIIVSQLICLFASGHFYKPGGTQADAPGPLLALLAALGGIGVAAAAGAVIGLLITRLKLAPFIVTLGMWSALRGIAKVLGNESMVRSPPTWLNTLLKSKPAAEIPEGGGTFLFHLTRVFSWLAHMPYAVWLTAILALLVALMLRYTRFGRHVYAIGSNESTARLCGVRVDLAKVMIYTLGATFAGIAGVLQFSFVKMGDPTTANGKELDVIAAVVVGGASLSGGRGGVTGTILGALIMSIVDNGCTNAGISNSYQQILTGAIIILAVAADRLRWKSRD